MPRRTMPLVLATMAVIGLAAASPAVAKSDHKTVVISDDCEPVTFNAAVGPGTCVGNGRTTFAEFRATLLALIPPQRWNFSRDDFGLDAGGRIDVVSRGGEFHTFTHVGKFGNGCSPLNNGDAVATDPDTGVSFDCATFDFRGGVLPGESITVGGLQPGTALFQCMIHPWMRSVVDVRASNRGGQG